MISRNRFDKTIYKFSFPGLVYLNTHLVSGGSGVQQSNKT